MTRVPVRDDLQALEGYHSPQVSVAVRLNTNESPEPPPAAWRDALAAELARVEWHRYPDRSARDLRDGLLARRAWPAIALASALVVAGHAVTFLIAARTAGATAPPSQMLPLALLVMLAGVLPNVGGWGPREGVAAWAFATAGLGASLGVATAVVYGVVVLVASLPGAVVLLAELGVPVRLEGAPDV